MKWQWTLGILLTLALASTPAEGGFIFRKGTKADPKVRVPELLGVLKSDPDEHKRVAAAEELRDYDVQYFPDIVTVLSEVLLQDPKASVRAEAAQSLGKIRPISPVAGQALEQSLAKDSAMRVRLQARSALLQYQWAGYKGKSKDTPPLYQTGEPPLADPPAETPAPTATPPAQPPSSTLLPRPGLFRRQTPPAATPTAAPLPTTAPRPLPSGPTAPMPTPLPAPIKDGPDLGLPPS